MLEEIARDFMKGYDLLNINLLKYFSNWKLKLIA
jgi:hypothetical protein